ncbi:peptidase S8/S53 domain-containing protein [Armillaria novae-zelandiae]|uniref:Peptidase S8/S53 domain-containing protein n=1 Tax=Armillaria novae-zelandiae TaxID=153914 RepID=A0AA39PLF3_9AGAR|nr:peptidase S8/S53 domain-containing protein [Armillaria novae-zelandiae]
MTSLICSSLYALSLAATVYASPLSTFSQHPPSRSSLAVAPLISDGHAYGSINDSYIVILKDGHPMMLQNHLNYLQTTHHSDPLVSQFNGLQLVFDKQIKGYSGHFSPSTIEELRKAPEVDFIEKDQIVKTLEIGTVDESSVVQKAAPWGLARISHRPKLTFGTFTKYEYNSNGGEGVDVYVIDTGINTRHVEFEGRAMWGKTIPTNDVDEDGNGHGSHCAGTIAGKTYGVAKKANVIAVKVLGSNGSGSMSDVVGGVAWAAGQAIEKAAASEAEYKATGKTSHKGSVANMSLGGGKSPALDAAVNKAVDAGLHFAVAAGNDNKDACNYSPASAEKAVTVGASTLSDDRAYFSNHGKCVDVFAPGLNIKSTYKGSTTAVATLSGTSMASPHVAGLLAYYLSLYPHQTFDPAVQSDFVPADLQSQSHFSSSIYAIARSAFPRWISNFLPMPEIIEAIVAPTPKPGYLSPKQMKTAVLSLASEGLLDDIPGQTPNLLVFNNATTA